jgi:ribosomal protein L11 methyltransferase
MTVKNETFYELKLNINPQMSEIISDICFEKLGCEGIITSDEELEGSNLKQNVNDEYLKIYLRSIRSVKEILKQERDLLIDRGFTDEELGSWNFEVTEIQNQDWSKKWKENWEVTSIGEKIKVVPTTRKYNQKKDEIIVTLDPETAFGTGCHATTQLCVLAMEKYMQQGATVADIGTGTGILAICAIKLGASAAYGCDNDESVIKTAVNNAQRNNVEKHCMFEFKTADKINQKFDFVCANILHFVIIEIMDDLKKLLKKDGYLALSGILDEKKFEVIDAIQKHGLEIVEETHQDIWTGFICK